MLRKFTVAVVAMLAGVVLATGHASATTLPTSYHATIRVAVPPPAYGSVVGRANLNRVGNADRWNSSVEVEGLPAGTYRSAIGIGEDSTGDGVADHYSLVWLCFFRITDDRRRQGGCSSRDVTLGHADIGRFAWAEVINIGGNSTFTKANGPLLPCKH